jgi:5-methylcytosine-specific restriction endonuclease McrA
MQVGMIDRHTRILGKSRCCPTCLTEKPTAHFARFDGYFNKACSACRRIKHGDAARKADARRAKGIVKRPYKTREQIAVDAEAKRQARKAKSAAAKAQREAARSASVPKWKGSKWWYGHATAVEIAAYRREIAARSRAYYAETVQHQRARTKRYKWAHPNVVSRHHAERQQRIEQADDGTLTPRSLASLFNSVTTCPYCDKPLRPAIATLDHLTPLARGGRHSLYNVTVACGDCNTRKGIKTPLEFMWAQA